MVAPAAIRVEPEIPREMETVLDESETLSAFIESAVRRETHSRKHKAEFLASGRASLGEARKTGRTVPVKSVMAKLDEMIDAQFGPGRSRKKAASA